MNARSALAECFRLSEMPVPAPWKLDAKRGVCDFVTHRLCP